MSAPDDVADGARDDYRLAACGLLTTTPSGAIVRVNDTLCLKTGFTAAELTGRRFQDLLTVGSRLFHHTHWMPLLQLQGSVAEVQLELVRRDGRVLPVLVNAVRRPAPDAAQGLVDIAVMIAADRRRYERELLLARRRAEDLLASEREARQGRAHAEARLRMALESASLRVWSAELPDGARRYELGVGAMLGRADDAAVTHDDFAARMHPDDRALDAAAFEAAVDPARRALYYVEHRLRGDDGVERIVRSTGRAFFRESGEAVHFSGLLEDVTDRRAAEEARRQRERDAQQRALLAEQLIGIVSHDLRNPLNAVVIGAHLLSRAALGDHARTVQRIASAAQRANRLIADLLDFTQARLGGGLRVAPKPIDLHRLVADCLDEVRLATPERVIDHRAVGEGPCLADPDRLAQVVSNLVNNALAYSAPGAVVTVTTRGGDDAMELVVHNDGPAIPDEVLPRIFEPMRRGERDMQAGSRSVGLGLYIVREIASAHGGEVTVRSTPAEGTTFVVRIPRAPRDLGGGSPPSL